MKRKCDYCGGEYEADNRNVKRGWGLCCSKPCAAKKREFEKELECEQLKLNGKLKLNDKK